MTLESNGFTGKNLENLESLLNNSKQCIQINIAKNTEVW